ncbi:hypothetical protein [Azospirillum canadense]|uniref:hypothetical protein n=1 Tax=Azospirillum canadense TaxID=403962 RepID=UPI0022272AF6|nr:hypothetical protein [Azospirillum canadense]MCW2239470.1 hypothetical protein [Azospirillum canadense]
MTDMLIELTDAEMDAVSGGNRGHHHRSEVALAVAASVAYASANGGNGGDITVNGDWNAKGGNYKGAIFYSSFGGDGGTATSTSGTATATSST